MSRRPLTLAFVALASLAVAACGTSPTAPQGGIRTPDAATQNLTTPPPPTDTLNRGGWSGSNG